MINTKKFAQYLALTNNFVFMFPGLYCYMYFLQKRHLALYNSLLFKSDIFVSKNKIDIPDVMSGFDNFWFSSNEKWFLNEVFTIKNHPELRRSLYNIFKGNEYILDFIKKTPISSTIASWGFYCFPEKHDLLKTDRLYQDAIKRKDKKIIFPVSINHTFKESVKINVDTGIKDNYGQIIRSGDFVKYENKNFSFSGIVLYSKTLNSYSIFSNKINPYMNDLNENSYFERLAINPGHSVLLCRS